MLAYLLVALLAAIPILSAPIESLSARQSSYVKQLYLLKDPLISDNDLIKSAGFNTVIVFQVGVEPNGDIIFYGANANPTVATGGQYVGGSAYADTISAYKTGSTTIQRVELAILSGSMSYQSIKSLIASNGTGPNTPLYENFKALKAAWDLDAINDDDEEVYDVSSTVAFAGMMGEIGYKYTAAPYTNQAFWAEVISQVNQNSPGLFDRAYLQTYDGGEGNDPGQWGSALGMPVIPLVWVSNPSDPQYGETPTQAQLAFETWHLTETIAGGGYWNSYDIENSDHADYDAYAQALTNVFG
ncbi:coagulation factor 5/8 type domain-containing protein [Kockovaella imperatae]|uniref:Coagulation factor 5/8 type domain-containing protein n=1 Tax=Kockovaella imperatae TaxID=4999 RepID=A0A1Y1UJJ8_9TREE|nr:coagulation factor 5/8 type domain-containing protein [Kockovaella imperatae]ORX38159.1 coagulation factor 5/8 type domain-containing protein [Kockovaella imperatae]